MKKIILVAAIIAVGIVAGIFFISANNQYDENANKTVKVGLVLISSKEDGSWSQTHYEALLKTKDQLRMELIYRDNIPEDETCLNTIEELIGEGCEIIICTSFGHGEYALKAAAKHPEIFFFHATGVEQARNLTTFFGRIYQMRYLSGVVAGLQTESNSIGYVAAFPISEVNRGLNAFTLGVRSVNPEARVYVSFCNSWNSDEAAKASSELLYQRHPDIDIFAMHTDSMAVCEFAEEHKLWSIGYNVDNYKRFQNSYLTAPVWNWENYYTPKIKECMQGKFQSDHTWAGIETGVVNLATLSPNVKSGIAEAVEIERKHLENFDYDVFFGPVRDNEGNIRISDGESMTDDKMLNAFDWYVDGVVIENE